MLQTMHPVWLIVLGLVLAPPAARMWLKRRQRHARLWQLASERQLKLSTVDTIGLHDRYHNLDLIRRGHNRHAWDVLYGTSEAGHVAAFRYSYDLGFGVQQSSRHWWVAVLESTALFDGWQARPAGPPDGPSTVGPSTEGMSAEGACIEEKPFTDESTAGIRLGPFLVRADHWTTLESLASPATKAIFLEMPYWWHLEARGPLLAIAAPAEEPAVEPGALIDGLYKLADRLRPLS